MESMKKAAKLLNRYCRILKVPGIRIVKCIFRWGVGRFDSTDYDGFMVVANKKWRIFPALTSLLLLIFRIALKNDIRAIKEEESEEDYWKYLVENFSSDYDIKNYCAIQYSYFKYVFDYFDYLFEGYSPSTFVDNVNLSNVNVGGTGGMEHFCNFTTYDPTINSRFMELIKKYDTGIAENSASIIIAERKYKIGTNVKLIKKTPPEKTVSFWTIPPSLVGAWATITYIGPTGRLSLRTIGNVHPGWSLDRVHPNMVE